MKFIDPNFAKENPMFTEAAKESRPAIAHIGTFPPTKCGLATFGNALISSMRGLVEGIDIGVVDVVESLRPTPPGCSVQLRNDDPMSEPRVADFVNEFDVVILEHEFGIFGGDDGRNVLRLLSEVRTPLVTVLHTVPANPSVGQKAIIEELARRSSALVVMSRAASQRLIENFSVDAYKVRDIPHGTHVVPNSSAYRGRCDRPTILTWGLLGPGKGIEIGIDAMAGLNDLIPTPRYLVVGETHPKVLAAGGQSYRTQLVDRAHDRGVGHIVQFDDRYRSVDDLCALVTSADVVLIPYDTREQVTSGVLVEAIAAGRPVVATAFPHAKEMLGSGAGIVVDHGDVEGISAALRHILTNESSAAAMRAEAGRLAVQLSWPQVASQYLDLVESVAFGAHVFDGRGRLLGVE